jgi:hypothetical protein
MNRLMIGHLIRIVGLLIEVAGVWAVYTSRNEREPAVVSFPGGRVVPAAWLAVGLGFVLWLIGTIVVSVSRSRRPITKSADDGADAALRE